MAIKSKETEVIGKGIDALTISNSSFVQNMYWREGAWHVRKGFGTLGEFDSTLSKYTENIRVPAVGEGYQKHLGSHLMRTDFGHEQIISVFELLGWTTTMNDSSAKRLNMFAVHIYDITTDDHWEELVTFNTSESDVALPLRHGHYEEAGTYANPVIKQTNTNNQVSFAEQNDILYMVSETLGILYYKPASFRGNRSKAIETTRSTSVYSDNTLINRLVLTSNLSFSAEYDYFEFFPQPIMSLSSLGNRLVYLAKDRIYISDNNNKSQSVVIDNALLVPSDYDITAAKEINGNLLIFTEKETFVFQPSQTFLPIQGRLTKISESVGCSNAGVVTKFHNTVLWADGNGVHTNGGDLSIDTISGGLKNFWDSYLTNPISHYLTETGEASAIAPQPKIQTSYDPSFANICYFEELKLILLTIPSQRITLCLSENKEWSLWSWDSPAYFETEGLEDVPKVGVRQSMSCEQIVASPTEMYAIGLDDTNKISTDYAKTWDGAAYQQNINRLQAFKSFYITHYGRGGAIDRSSEEEDYRYGIGEWEKQAVSPLAPPLGVLDASAQWELYFGEPLKVEKGLVVDGTTLSQGSLLVPVYAKAPFISFSDPWQYTPLTLQIQFDWDGENWLPVNTGNKVNIIFPSPMERLGAGMGFGIPGFPMGVNAQAQITTTSRMNIDVDAFTASGPGGTYNMTHFLNQVEVARGNQSGTSVSCIPLVRRKKTLLFYIPFEAANALTTSKMNINTVAGFMFYDNFDTVPVAATNYFRAQPYVFNQSKLGPADLNTQDAKAQGVTWAYSSAPVGIEDSNRYKARGIWAQLKSKGTADNEITNGWGTTASKLKPRTYNTVVSSDNRQWNSQVVDYADTEGISQSDLLRDGEQNSIRTQIRNTNNVMGYKVFGDTDNTWGDKGTQVGTVLIDDKQFGSLNDSNSVRGEWFSWMFFGHMLNKAEELVIKSAKAAVRVLGGRRRKGH